jgi:DNA-binding response OmpR family regulator
MPKNILIVEDDSFLLELYTHQFAKSGFNIISASDGKKALELVKKEKFDLILLDIMIPKLNGLEVLKEITSLDKNIPVVILSNIGNDEIIKKALQEGAKAFIIKSRYTPDQVVNEVKSILGM